MEAQSSHPSQVTTHAPIAGLLPYGASSVQAHGVTVNHGGFTQAGRDINIHHHYHTLPGPVVNILEVLSFVPNLRKVHLDVLSKATDGTGVWFLKTKSFLFWVDLDGNIKILWGTGIPGAGKSVMASIVIRDLEARAAAAGGSICLAYLYFRYSDAANLTLNKVLEILVKQTVERHADCVMLAEQVYAQHRHEKTQPTVAELLELLDQFTKAKAGTFYVLDALDEAPDRLRVMLVKRLSSLNVRLFITSRPLKDVEGRFPEACSFPIVAQEDDLDLHINEEIANSSVLEELLEGEGQTFKDEMVSLVKKNCGGMFLHASLQLDAISRCTSTQDVTETLEAFPSEIDAVYRQTWKRICRDTPKNAMLAKTVLICLLTAARSMTIDELRHVIATSPDTHKFERKRLVPTATLVSLCCGLVTVEEETKLVRLVHYTAKDTLDELLRKDFPRPHPFLAAICMTHLVECGFQNTAIASEGEYAAVLQADPLLAYASHAWAAHARESLGVAKVNLQTAEFISNCKSFPSFLDYKHSQGWDIIGPLHILATHHLPPDLLQGESIGDPNVTTKIVKETPLNLASWHGNEEMVRDLLRLPDTQVNSLDRDGTSALMLAAQAGHEGIVNILLARPEIQVNNIDITGLAALISAALNGHEAIATALLTRHDTQVNLVNISGSPALLMATANGHKGTVKLLLAQPDINVNLSNTVDGSGWTALMEAVNKGREDIVKLLLERPEIEVNLVDSNGWSAFSLAARLGYEGIVKCFISRPDVQINLVNSEGWSALMSAIAYGHEGTVKLLLAHPDIDVHLASSVNRLGWTTLMEAAFNGREGIVKLLLAHHTINVNLADNMDGLGWTALMDAVHMGHNGIVELLAHPEIEINSVSSGGWSALMLAIGRGCEGVVQLLLAHPKIQVNRVNSEGWSPLMMATSQGHSGITKLFLARSDIQVNLVDRNGRSPLRLAVDHGLDGIVKLLLAHPDIQVNMADNGGSSPLEKAAYLGFEGTVSALLAHPDTNVNAVNVAGQSALMLATLIGHEGVVRLLLAHPDIRVNSVDNDGHSALLLAERGYHEGCVALLTAFTGNQDVGSSLRQLADRENSLDDSSSEWSDAEFYDAKESLEDQDDNYSSDVQ